MIVNCLSLVLALLRAFFSCLMDCKETRVKTNTTYTRDDGIKESVE